VASRYGAEVSGATEIALTKLDPLSGLKTLNICTAYHIGARTLENFPITPELIQAEPVYTEMPGWQEDIRNVRKYEQLPAAAQKYVEGIERLVERPIKYVSVGPHRKAMILR
jgi:adenylosuccinate synthase